MPSLYITTRQTSAGPRYVVRYRLGGRSYPVAHGGSFKTLKDAKARLGLVAGEIAAGRNPAVLLRAMTETTPMRTFASVYDAFVGSRVDVAAATKANYQTHRIRLVGLLEDRDPATITWEDVQQVVTGLATDLAPGSVRGVLGTLRQVLDYAGCDPNPVKDPRVRLPRQEAQTPHPPTGSEVAAIIANAPRKWQLALRVLEQTGMRVSEVCLLEWGDVDRANLRLRVQTGKTNAARRWVPIPEWLMEELEATCPPDDRTETRRVFQGANRQTIGVAMRRGCKAAGIANYGPHSLRHRYISVKLREGIPITEIAAHVGHSRKSLTLDTYAHVLIDE